jgi:hypothetical protein
MLKAKDTDIQTLKLSTGEEIIAKIVHAGPNVISVTRPLALVLAEMPGNPQQTQVMFTPWMLGVTEDQEINIDGNHVIARAPARKDAAEQYVAATRPAE